MLPTPPKVDRSRPFPLGTLSRMFAKVLRSMRVGDSFVTNYRHRDLIRDVCRQRGIGFTSQPNEFEDLITVWKLPDDMLEGGKKAKLDLTTDP